jgi:hypothetical protein
MIATSKCRVCNRPLSNPVHAAAGIGPVCADKLGLSYKRQFKAARKPRNAQKPARRTQGAVAVPLPLDEAPGLLLDVTS